MIQNRQLAGSFGGTRGGTRGQVLQNTAHNRCPNEENQLRLAHLGPKS
jgi:hypothetical protein